MHNNPFIEKRKTIALPALVTRVAALTIASGSFMELSQLCAQHDKFRGVTHCRKLLQTILDDYTITFDRLRTYAVEYTEKHATLIAK